jgi:phosphomannomutase
VGLIRSVAGVRGIVDQDLHEGTVCSYTRAFAEQLEPGTVLVVFDGRPHGERLMQVAARALSLAGNQVVLADLAPTPTAQYVVPRKHLAGALVLTASHNPIEYNGLKFIGSDGCFLDHERMERLFQRADQLESPVEIPSGKVKSRLLLDAPGLHILGVLDLSCIDVGTILRKRFRVVVDTVNAAASFALPALLEALGCQVIRLHTTPDGTFPRGAEPLAENLDDLGRSVKEHGAHLGMATDPDGDRLALVDEKGVPIGEEYTQVLAIDAFLRRTGSRKPVTTNLSSSMLLDHVAGKYGIEVLRTAVGEVNVVQGMRLVNGDIGGEGSGGVILAEAHLGRDSLVGAALVLDRLVQDEEPLSEIVNRLPRFHIVKDRIAIDNTDTQELDRQVAAKFPDAEHITLDGLKLQWNERWIHVRQSSTEPIIRLFAEAATEEAARELIRQVREIIDAA